MVCIRTILNKKNPNATSWRTSEGAIVKHKLPKVMSTTTQTYILGANGANAVVPAAKKAVKKSKIQDEREPVSFNLPLDTFSASGNKVNCSAMLVMTAISEYCSNILTQVRESDQDGDIETADALMEEYLTLNEVKENMFRELISSL